MLLQHAFLFHAVSKTQDQTYQTQDAKLPFSQRPLRTSTSFCLLARTLDNLWFPWITRDHFVPLGTALFLFKGLFSRRYLLCDISYMQSLTEVSAHKLWHLCQTRQPFPIASWTALSSKHTSPPKSLSGAILVFYSISSNMYWYPASTPLLVICGPGNSFVASVPNVTVGSHFSTVITHSLTAIGFCMPKQPELGISAASWSTASATTSCRIDFSPSLTKLAAWLSGWLPASADLWSVESKWFYILP